MRRKTYACIFPGVTPHAAQRVTRGGLSCHGLDTLSSFSRMKANTYLCCQGSGYFMQPHRGCKKAPIVYRQGMLGMGFYAVGWE